MCRAKFPVSARRFCCRVQTQRTQHPLGLCGTLAPLELAPRTNCLELLAFGRFFFFFVFFAWNETKIHLLCETPNKAKLCNFSLLFCLFWSLLLPVFGEEHGSEIFIKQIISVHVDCNLFQMFSLHATEQRFVRWKLFSWKLWAWPKLFCRLELTGKSFLESILDFFEDVIDEFYIWFLIFVSCYYYWSYFFLFSFKSIKYQKINLTTASQIYDTSAASFPPLDLVERVMRQLKDHTSKSQILR